MSTTLAGLRADIQDITENTFTNAQLDLFIKTAEQTLHNTVQLPELRINAEDTLTEDVATYGLPENYLYTFSLAVKDSNNVVTYLLPKDNSFLLEAYPDQDTRGVPKYYAQYEKDKLVVVPTPSSALSIIHTYAAYPASITAGDDTGTTWLGENMDSVLLYASLVEAAIFMKAEPDVIAMYKEQLNIGLKLLKMLGDGKLNGDAYRGGQPTVDIL